MRRNLKSENSFASQSSRTAASASVDSAASFQTAATSGTVGSSLLRNVLPSMRNTNTGNTENGEDVDVGALQRELTDLRSDLDLMRANRQQEQRVYKLELHKLECEKSALDKRISVLLRDMDDKNAMGEYAMLIKKAAPGTVDSTYVLKLQSQLAKAMHQMGVIQNQLTLTQQACDGVVQELRDEMRKITERNSKSELDYLNQIMKLQDDNISMKRQIESMVAATDAEAITEEEEEEGEVEEEDGHDGAPPPPVQGVFIKTSSKSRVGSCRHRSSDHAADAGRGCSDRDLEAAAEPCHAQRKAASSPRGSAQNSFNSEQRKPSRSSSDRRKAVDDGESAPSSSPSRPSQRKSSSRTKVDSHPRSSEDHVLARPSQLKSSSKSKLEDRPFGEGMMVAGKSSSGRAKSDIPKQEADSSDGGPVPDIVAKSRSSARRSDRLRRQRSVEDQGVVE